MQHLTHTRTENPSKTIHVNQPNIYDINIQRQELNKGMHIENTLKGKLNSQQKTNASWLVTTINTVLKTPIQKSEKTILSFRRTHEAAVRNSKILAAFNGDPGAEILAQRDSLVNYGLEFRDTAVLEKVFFYHEDRDNIINIIQQGYRYHLDPIKEETRKSDYNAMVLNGNHKSPLSELNSAALDKAIRKRD